MTYVHDTALTAVKVDFYPDEFKPIMKAVRYALLSDPRDSILNEEEWATVNAWLNDFSDIALNELV